MSGVALLGDVAAAGHHRRDVGNRTHRSRRRAGSRARTMNRCCNIGQLVAAAKEYLA
jgi:hypothetical protein